jgi:hypothetical protein
MALEVSLFDLTYKIPFKCAVIVGNKGTYDHCCLER